MSIKVTNKDFENIISNNDITLIDFYADWCGPCKALAPIIDDIAKNEAHITVGKVNVEEERDLATKYGVRSIPTMIVFKNGKEIKRLVGFLPKEQILERIV